MFYTGIFIYLCTVPVHSSIIEDKVRLKADLLQNYDPEISPALNHSDTVHIHLSYFAKAIIDVDDVKSAFKTFGATVLWWIDKRLTWNPVNYSGIDHIVCKAKHFWTPVIYTINAVSTVFDTNVREFPLRLYANGTVLMQHIDVVETSFTADMTYFPFDQQTCSIQMALAGYYPEEVRLTNDKNDVDLRLYSENNEWMIKSTHAKQLELATHTGLVEFQFVLERRHLYLTINMLTPVFMLVVVGPNILLLPVESGERVSFTVTIVLAFGVFLAHIGDHLPEASNPMSYLSYYLMICLVCSSLLSLFTMFTTYIYFKDESKPVPKWLVFILNVLSLRFVQAIRKCNSSKGGKVHAISEKGKPAFDNDMNHVQEEDDGKCINGYNTTWKTVARRLDRIVFVYIWVGIFCLIIYAIFVQCTRTDD